MADEPVVFTWTQDGVIIECRQEVIIYRRQLTLDEINKVGQRLANRCNTNWRTIV